MLITGAVTSSGARKWARPAPCSARRENSAYAAINPNSANERRLAAAANFQIIHDPNNGMLVATHHPKFNEEQQRVKEKQQSRAELASAKPR